MRSALAKKTSSVSKVTPKKKVIERVGTVNLERAIYDLGLAMLSEYEVVPSERYSKISGGQTMYWKCRIFFGGGKFIAVKYPIYYSGDGEPKAEDVMNCLLSEFDNGGLTFDEFCDKYDHDIDSRQAEKIWRMCVGIRRKLIRLIPSERHLSYLLTAIRPQQKMLLDFHTVESFTVGKGAYIG